MAAPTLTYTLTNGATADASQVQQNFTDLLNGITDGTKDLSLSALTCAGTATLNGHVNLGNSSVDDLTITASLASALAIKTDNTYDVGSSTLRAKAIYGANYYGNTGGSAISAGFIGQIVEANSSDATFAVATDIESVTLTTGVWLVTGTVSGNAGSAGAEVMTAQWKIKGTTDTTAGKGTMLNTQVSTERGYVTMPARVVVVASGDADKTVKLRVTNSITQATDSYILAVRIA